MIITAIFLIIDWLVFTANGYTLLSYHSWFIAGLVIMLWSHRQPDSYNIDSESLQNMGKSMKTTDLKNCLICLRPKPSRYYHCRRCQKCIFMMDHHCEWVSNCIGQYNSKIYFHLLLNVFVHSFITILVITYNYDLLLDTSTRYFYFCITLLPHLYALYQSYRLMHDFKQSIRNNVTLIESYKKVRGRKWDFVTGLKYHFGPNCYLWILPLFVNNPDNLLEQTFPLPNQTVKERVYADQYLDGSDSQDYPVIQQHNQ